MQCLTGLTFFLLEALESILKNQLPFYYNITFDILASRITHLSNCTHDAGLKIFKYLIVGGYDIFPK